MSSLETNGLTRSLVDVNDWLVSYLETNMDALGILGVAYGDQQRIPTTPYACVEPDLDAEDYKGGGANRMMAVNFTHYIILYHSEITSPQSNRRNADLLGQAVKDLIHSQKTMGGLVIECHVSAVQSGYSTKGNTVMRASRITVSSMSQALLPS